MNNTRWIDYCLAGPDLFLENGQSMVQICNPPSDYVFTGMSKDIWSTVENNKQTIVEFTSKINIWRNFNDHCRTGLPAYGLFLGGSTLNGFGLIDSDVDFSIFTKPKGEKLSNKQAKNNLSWIKNVFKSNVFVSKIKIVKGFIPHINLQETFCNLSVDLTLDTVYTIQNTHLLFRYCHADWRVQPLGIILKLFAKNQDLFEKNYNSFSCFHLMIMLIHFLQCGVKPAVVPNLQHFLPHKFKSSAKFWEIDFFEKFFIPFQSSNKQTLEELLLEFFNYYKTFNFEGSVISIRLGAAFPLNQFLTMASRKKAGSFKSSYLKIEDPFSCTNASRTVSNTKCFAKVRIAFKKAHERLNETRDIYSIFPKFLQKINEN